MPLARTACAMNPCRVGSATFCSMAKVHNITCGRQSCQLGLLSNIWKLEWPAIPAWSFLLMPSSSHHTEEQIQAPSSSRSRHITWLQLVVKQKLYYIAAAVCWWWCKTFSSRNLDPNTEMFETSCTLSRQALLHTWPHVRLKKKPNLQ